MFYGFEKKVEGIKDVCEIEFCVFIFFNGFLSFSYRTWTGSGKDTVDRYLHVEQLRKIAFLEFFFSYLQPFSSLLSPHI